MTAPAGTAAPAPALLGTLAACLIAVFVQMLDLTMVSTAVPVVADDLDATASARMLVVSAYSAVFACSLLSAARLGDILGRGRLYVGGMTGFILASGWCALADTAGELVLARCAQGLCAAAVSAQTLAIIVAAFPRERRAVVFGIYGGVAGFAAIAGPMLGGALADTTRPGWRAIFLIDVLLGGLAVLTARRYLKRERPPGDARLDPVGMTLSAVGLLGVLYPLAVGRESGWPPMLLGLLAASALLLIGLVAHQRRHRDNAVLRAELFSDRRFAVGAILMIGFYLLFAAFPVTVSVTFQSGLRYSALDTGLLMLPCALGAIAGAVTSPILVSRSGSRTLTFGMALVAAATALLAATIDPAQAAVDTPAVIGSVLLVGVGMGWFAAPLQAVLVSGVTDDTSGSASGTVPTIQQVGSAAGPAVLGTLLFAEVATSADEGIGQATMLLAREITGAEPARRTAIIEFASCAHTTLTSAAPDLTSTTCRIGDPTTAASLEAAARLANAHSYLSAYQSVLWVITAIATGLTLITLVLPRSIS
ncbi:MFS transporter [Nocardia sp. NPDC127579]|uniref:MFS transporter n=1 Tax=Nocardia sp. NPDC127579 TaxID=3345402 RepID=UPI003639D958